MPSISTVSAVINGQTYNLTLDSASGKYKATITAPSKSSYNEPGHYYDVKVTAEDEYGNTVSADSTHATLGESLQLRVKEKTKPVIAVTAPTAGATVTNNKPVIKINVTDSDSGIDTSTFKLYIDNGPAITWSSGSASTITNGYTWTYTPTTALSDGSHTLKIDVSDHDGNAATQKTSTFKVDTTPPVLSVTTPTDNYYTKETSLTVNGTTNDATSSPVTITIKVNNVDAGAVTVQSNGSFSKPITLISQMSPNVIVVTATDGAGKTSSVTRNVYCNTVAPVISEVTIEPNPVDAGATYVITVTVS